MVHAGGPDVLLTQPTSTSRWTRSTPLTPHEQPLSHLSRVGNIILTWCVIMVHAQVDLTPEFMVVGAPGVNQTRGAAYVFRLEDDMWIASQQLLLPDGQPGRGGRNGL